jgi:arylsulfatase
LKPNILWICTDQQRFDTLGCYGNSFVNTPNIDQLAEKGVLFDHSYSQSPVCTPSRASFLTGRYPRTTRCRQNGQTIPPDEVLVTKLLSDAGYTCGLSGKLHLSACHPSVTTDREFRIDDGYAEFNWSHHPKQEWPTNEYNHWLTEKGLSFETRPFEGSKYVEIGPAEEHHHTTWCAEKAINFIKANASFESPWLFSVNMFDPHHPFDPPEDYLNRYLEIFDELPLPNFTPGELDNKPIFQQIDHDGAYGIANNLPFSKMNNHDHRALTAAYWAMVDLIDKQVGRMIDALKATGQLENTIIIFMADHGELLGDHGIYLKGPHFYDPCVRVPLVISYPSKVKTNKRIETMVELVDLAPTLLEAAGLPIYKGMQGKSLWELITKSDDHDSHREDVYCEYYDANFPQKGEGAQATMLRTKQYKFVVYHGKELGELYDLEKDPSETNNLWNHSNYQSVKLTLFKRLSDRMAGSVDPLPERQAAW